MKHIPIIVFILLLSLACTFNMGTSTGGEARMEESGFSVEVPAGYEMASLFGELQFNQKNVNISEGPSFLTQVNPPSNFDNASDYLDDFESRQADAFGYQYSDNRSEVTFGGVSGLMEDYTGVADDSGAPIAGKVAVAILPDGRKFLLTGKWPPDQAKSMEAVFMTVLNSTKFFEPVPPTPTP